MSKPAVKEPLASSDITPVAAEAHLINADREAADIGDLYRSSRVSLADALRLAIQCGQKLIAKKHSLAHGQWLPWLHDNADTLGFNTDRTARLLMAAAKRKPASDLDETTALTISRTLWGHAPLGFAPKFERTQHVAASAGELKRTTEHLSVRGIEQDEEINGLQERHNESAETASRARQSRHPYVPVEAQPTDATSDRHDRCRVQVRALITNCLDEIPQKQWPRLIAEVRDEIDHIELEAEKRKRD